jgi:hypothetical protein
VQRNFKVRSFSALQDKLKDIDNFENMTKAERKSVCYWLARSMMAKQPTTGKSIIKIVLSRKGQFQVACSGQLPGILNWGTCG